MNVRVGLDIDQEQIFVELFGEGGLKTTATMNANVAMAIATQLIANANALNTSMEEGHLGNDKNDN